MIACRLLWRDPVTNWYDSAAIALSRIHPQRWRHCRLLARIAAMIE